MIKFIILLISAITFPQLVSASDIKEKLAGKILLQVEEAGEAWYVNPKNLKRYYLGRPKNAFELMQQLGLGVSNTDFENFSSSTPQRLSGRILLKVEDKGQAHYVNPDTLKMHYLGRPEDAFDLMRSMGLGITNKDLFKINEKSEFDELNILMNVPFISQAPLAEWDNPLFQDGCEETSLIMANAWIENKELNAKDVRDEILSISNFEDEHYGRALDRSAQDTANLFKDYYNQSNYELKYDFQVEDIIKELKQGNIITVPVNGRKVGNIYFIPPGPINHMILIIGYDGLSNEFIANDPGTKNGARYRYKQEVLFKAIRDYPTGHHEPNLVERKAMIVISK